MRRRTLTDQLMSALYRDDPDGFGRLLPKHLGARSEALEAVTQKLTLPARKSTERHLCFGRLFDWENPSAWTQVRACLPPLSR